MPHQIYDICIIGGGINGTGIARDASGQGLSVLLLEKNDIASATSSASTKIIHGGLRYLEHYEFSLVRKALKEREILLQIAPHIIRPMDFVLPHAPQMRPKWLIRLGLFLYDNLATRKTLRASTKINTRTHAYGAPLMDKYKTAFVYSDGWVDDSRLTLLNALDAAEHGATILPHTACNNITAKGKFWQINYGNNQQANAKTIINAAGPWAHKLLKDNDLIQSDTPQLRHVKGSHIIIPSAFEGQQSYILQNDDDRIIFAIPYHESFTLIGTTDIETDQFETPKIDEKEIEYLCTSFNNYFEKNIKKSDVIHSFSGVRPLLDSGDSDASAVTRDYNLRLDRFNNQHILTVFGGKITTYRTLAEEAIEKIAPALDITPKSWTQNRPLPGGNIAYPFENFEQTCLNERRNWPTAMTRRLARCYGSRLNTFPKDAGKIYDGLTCTAELQYSIENEFTRTIDDFLWRRTKLGLHLKPETIKRLSKDFLSLLHSKD